MKRNEHDDEDDVSDTERTEEGAQETKVQALCALPWNGGVMATLFMARPNASVPKCPDRSQTQLPSFLISAAFKTL